MTSKQGVDFLIYALLLLLSLCGTWQGGTAKAQGARSDSNNFIVFADSKELASDVSHMAEVYRKELALKWLGHELPQWRMRCPIFVKEGPTLGAGGATSFTFSYDGYSEPGDWHMEIQGSSKRILDSVLPHEVLHTVFATHFRQKLPRWADEGACTSIEDLSERTKHHKLLLRNLTSNKGIGLRRMFKMYEYPKDMLPLYAQGYSLVKFLVHQKGEQEFIRFVEEGLENEEWESALCRRYEVDNLADFQVKWLAWIKNGGLKIAPDTEIVWGQTTTTKKKLALVRPIYKKKKSLITTQKQGIQ
ncbi:MAG: hypothetical protein MPJ24_04080 [Pirellulaceae bacterium]|nr:hypothetical protein [Pirellulaceae bacterium]